MVDDPDAAGTLIVLVLFGTVLLRVGLVGLVVWLLIPRRSVCPHCSETTAAVLGPRALRVLRLERRWCMSCGWNGFSKGIRPMRTIAKSTATIPIASTALLLVGFSYAFALPATPHAPFRGGNSSLLVRAVAYRTIVAQGEKIPIAVVLDFGKGLFSWPHEPALPSELFDSAIPASLSVSSDQAVEIGKVVWPRGDMIKIERNAKEMKVRAYAGQVTIFVPVKFTSSPVGETHLSFTLSYQPCTRLQCEPAQTAVVTIPVQVVAAGTKTGKTRDAEIFVDYWDTQSGS